MYAIFALRSYCKIICEIDLFTLCGLKFCNFINKLFFSSFIRVDLLQHYMTLQFPIYTYYLTRRRIHNFSLFTQAWMFLRQWCSSLSLTHLQNEELCQFIHKIYSFFFKFSSEDVKLVQIKSFKASESIFECSWEFISNFRAWKNR